MININKLSITEFTAQLNAVWGKAEESGLIPCISRLTKALKNSTSPPSKTNDAVEARLKSKMERGKTIIQEGAYSLYENAYEGTLPCMVIGASKLKSSEEELKNFGTLSEKFPYCPPKLTSSLPEKLKGGILCDKSWSVIKNDAYILGSIHSQKTFYLFKEKEKLQSILWDKKNNRPHVTGREIAMLYEAGYRQVASESESEKYGATFVCLDPKKAENFTFEKALTAVSKICSIDDLYPMLKPVSGN